MPATRYAKAPLLVVTAEALFETSGYMSPDLIGHGTAMNTDPFCQLLCETRPSQQGLSDACPAFV